MKRILTLLLLAAGTLLFADVDTKDGVAITSDTIIDGSAAGSVDGQAVTGGGGAPTYLVNQNFETPTTGYDNGETWTANGTVDPDYTGVVLAGSQSLRIHPTAGTGSVWTAFTASDTVFVFMEYHLAAATGQVELFTIRAGTSGRCTVRINSAGKMDVTASGGTVNASTDNITTGSKIYVWVEYEKGTGSNAVARAGWSTTSTKPTLSAGGAKTCVSSNGTGTDQVTRLYIGNNDTETWECIADAVLVDDVVIP